MIWLYRLLFPFVLLALLPRYVRRMVRRGGYGGGFAQRFGSVPALPPRRPGVSRVWIQAVSVGEMLAIEPLLKALNARGIEVYLTTTTSTGHLLAGGKYRAAAIAIGYFPLDWAPFSARAWSRVRPDLAIIAEGERWPEHVHQAARRGIPVVCINARISDRSFRRMARFRPVCRLMLEGVTRVLAASEEMAKRFERLGVEPDRLAVTGNLKLDVAIPPLDAAGRGRLAEELGLSGCGLVLLGSSTWPGEEEVLVAALIAARARGIRCALLIVPRHAERRAEIERMLGATGLRWNLRSRGAAAGDVDVSVADTTGELRALTQLADVVFVGKSLAPHTEGQTPVEAAALAKALIMGPGMSNFREIAQDLVRRGAAIQLGGAEDLAGAAAGLLSDPERRAALGAAAAAWQRTNAGAVERTIRAIDGELAKSG